MFRYVVLDLLPYYTVALIAAAVFGYFVKRILAEADPFTTPLSPAEPAWRRWIRSPFSQSPPAEPIREYPESGIPGRWQWRSE